MLSWLRLIINNFNYWYFNYLLGDINIATEKQTRINADIRAPEIRLIDAEGEQVGIVSVPEALRKAEEAGLDLVEISPNAKPPVCRLMDYGKFRYQEQKRQQEARAKQKIVQLKEVKFRPATDEGDFQVKLRNVKRFLADGDKVKVSLRFRGREMAHQELGLEMLQRVRDEVIDLGTAESMPKLEGRQMVMVLSPAKK